MSEVVFRLDTEGAVVAEFPGLNPQLDAYQLEVILKALKATLESWDPGTIAWGESK